MSADIVQWVLGGGFFAALAGIVTAWLQHRSSSQKAVTEREAAIEQRFIAENERARTRADDAEQDARDARKEAQEAREEARVARRDRRRAEDEAALYRRVLIEHSIPLPVLPSEAAASHADN